MIGNEPKQSFLSFLRTDAGLLDRCACSPARQLIAEALVWLQRKSDMVAGTKNKKTR
jgi:hypothetical protein